MFSLSEAGKHNLEAIVHEFQRASQWYGPLYHERLVPWGGFSPATVSDDEWDKFIELESDRLPDNEWWEWEGPSARSPGWDASFLERWFGNPEGKDSFLNLVESTLTVLEGEDLSEIPDLEMPFDFSDAEGWTGTLHAWAFRFDMPLLRCTMKTWGREEDEPVELFDTANLWRHIDGGSRYPAHPIRWALTDDVFTSSIAALRALLYPHLVITTNEPWPLANSLTRDGNSESSTAIQFQQDAPHAEITTDNSEDSPSENATERIVDSPVDGNASVMAENAEARPTKVHELIQTQNSKWQVRFDGSDLAEVVNQQAGLHRIVYLIEHSPNSVDPVTLHRMSGQAVKRGGRPRRASEVEPDIELSFNLPGGGKRQKAYDADGAEELRRRMSDCESNLENALALGNADRAEELSDEIYKINERLNEFFRNTSFKNAKDNIRKSIIKAIDELKQNAPTWTKNCHCCLSKSTYPQGSPALSAKKVVRSGW